MSPSALGPRVRLAGALFLMFIAGCGVSSAPPTPAAKKTPIERLGERLFTDTRFAEFFAANMTDVNTPLAVGDPAVATIQTLNGPVPGPFAGQSMNCRGCHFVNDMQSTLGNRTYSDYTVRSALPRPLGNFTNTPRNAMQMVGSMAARSAPMILHFDGEFADGADLTTKTLTGRVLGWGAVQFDQATAHIARVIREDNGNNAPAKTYTGGISYAVLFAGSDPSIPADDLIDAQYRIDVHSATDAEVLQAVAVAVNAYMAGLHFQQDEQGHYNGSPYDAFLRANNLPVAPAPGQTNAAYAKTLLAQVQALGSRAVFITPADGSFQFHDQPFQFGQTELQGLIIFLSSAVNATDGSQHAGNCAACHSLPDFSDFRFHNSGVSQAEYDAVHGDGSFVSLQVPSLSERNANYNAYLPITTLHPTALETFRRPPDSNPQHADLGLWNIFLNPDRPNPQNNLMQMVCPPNTDCTTPQGQDAALTLTIGLFKTPVLRDLVDSAPYFHNGSKYTISDVIGFYIGSSGIARQGKMRNTPPEYTGMSIDQSDIQPLTAFLNSLTEDYSDPI